MFDITILGSGTSTGVPLIGCDCAVCKSVDAKDKRLRTSIKIQTNTTTVVIDTTPDFRYQMLRTQTTKIDAIVFTHPHRDHYAGLDDIRPFNFFSKKSMPIYANEITQEAIKRDFYYAFEEDKDAGLPEMILHTIGKESFTIGDMPFMPIQVMHRDMPVLGFRIGDFTYITDANFIPDTELEKIKGSKLLILNALRKEAHPTHYNLEQALAVIEHLGIPKVFLTHFSHQIGLHDQVEAYLPKGVHLAYDGLQLTVA